MNIDLTTAVPHRAPMLLLDRVIEVSAERIIAGVTITEKTIGFENGQVPVWFGVEYMAQAIAAFNGINYGTPGGKPEIGFLVGVRNYKVQVDGFMLGEELHVSVTPNFIVDNSGTFDCKISVNGQDVGESIITTYKPNQEFLDKLKGGGK